MTAETLPEASFISLEWNDDVKKNVFGMDFFIDTIINLIETWKLCPETSRGLLITGKSGSGKSFLVKELLKRSGFAWDFVACPTIFQSNVGGSERKLLNHLRGNGRRIIVLDDVDGWHGKHSATSIESHLNSMVLHHLDNSTDLFFIVIAKSPQSVDQRWLIPSRIHDTIHLNLTTSNQRLSILKHAVNRLELTPSQDLLKIVSEQTHAYTPADLVGLVNQVHVNLEDGVDEAFRQALETTRPAHLASQVNLQRPMYDFSQIHGMNQVLERVKTSIVDPLKKPEIYKQIGLPPPRGLLLTGPSGTGKTMLAQAIAKELAFNLISVDAPTIRSKIVGESERNLAKLFSTARENSPCVILLDNIHMLAPPRGTDFTTQGSGDRLVATMLMELDGVEQKWLPDNIFVIGTAPDNSSVDEAIQRPGRLDEHIELSIPSPKQVLEILQALLSSKPHNLSPQDIEQLASKMQSFTPAKIETLVNQATLSSLSSNQTLSMDNFSQEFIAM